MMESTSKALGGGSLFIVSLSVQPSEICLFAFVADLLKWGFSPRNGDMAHGAPFEWD
jgi:hypothetical protein